MSTHAFLLLTYQQKKFSICEHLIRCEWLGLWQQQFWRWGRLCW